MSELDADKVLESYRVAREVWTTASGHEPFVSRDFHKGYLQAINDLIDDIELGFYDPTFDDDDDSEDYMSTLGTGQVEYTNGRHIIHFGSPAGENYADLEADAVAEDTKKKVSFFRRFFGVGK